MSAQVGRCTLSCEGSRLDINVSPRLLQGLSEVGAEWGIHVPIGRVALIRLSPKFLCLFAHRSAPSLSTIDAALTSTLGRVSHWMM